MSPAGLEPSRDAVATLAGLASAAERHEFLVRHPQLLNREFGKALMIGVHRKLRVDLDHSERLALALAELAEELDDEQLRGLSLRADGHVLVFRRRYREALERYERSLACFERLGLESESAITRTSGLGALSHLGDFDRAERWAKSARRCFERSGDRLRLSRLELNIGHVLARRDRFREALDRYQSAYHGFLDSGTPMDVGIALRNIAVCHQDLNDFEAAVEAYERARVYCRDHELPLVGLEVEYNIAYLYYLRGEFERAIGLFESARASCERHEDHHHAALCELDLAEIYLELNLPNEASRLAERAHAGFERLEMDYECAKALAYRALAAHRLRRPDDALAALERARTLFAGQENRSWQAMVDLHRAAILADRGRSLEAHRLARQALETFSRERLPSKVALCRLLLARLEVERGDPAAALELCREALRQVRPLQLPVLEFQAHRTIGQAQEAMGHRQEALDAYAYSHGMLEDLRSHLPMEELKISFLEDKLSLYEGLVALAFELDDSPAGCRAAFAWIERAKSRSLADLLALGAGGVLRLRQEGELAETFRSLRERLNWFYRQIDREEMKGGQDSRSRLDSLHRETRRMERDLQRVSRKLQRSDREFGSLRGSLVSDLDAIRAALPAGGRLLEFFIARGTIYACLVDEDELRILPVASEATVRALHQKLQLQLSKFNLGPDYVEQFGPLIDESTRSILSRLYDELLRPAAGFLDCDHLVVVPHGFLHYLPFGALFDGERYLIDRCPVTSAPSATVYQLCCRRSARRGGGSLVLGVADERAPFILDEARAVAGMLPEARLLLGAEATRERLERLGRGCRYLHIATHGLYRRDNPLFSAIQLGDARLSLLDLYGLRLEPELAVLSGCGTGLSSVRGGDELVGLTRGLLYAGAASVLVTLWDVHDQSTADLMRVFYRQLGSGVGPARALRQAVREIRQAKPHPYFWAPFVLIGRPESEKSEKEPL